MDYAAGRVLKAQDIKMQGSFHLDVGHPVGKVGNAVSTPSVSPQVFVVENHADFAILEITCKCGTKTRIRCEYAG